MNWTRGFLRLWAVLAIGWVCAVTYQSMGKLFATYRHRECPNDRNGTPDILCVLAGPNDPSFDSLPVTIWPDWDKRISAAKLILLSPALLLLLGFAVAWIAWGFCSNAPPEGSDEVPQAS